MNSSYNTHTPIKIHHRSTTLRRNNMIIKKSNKLKIIVFGVLEMLRHAVKRN
jgi:uncharacterized protein YhhL (DUF1145 family)